MAHTNIATLVCTELNSSDEVVVIVDAGPHCVSLSLSLRQGDDAEAVLSVSDARRVLAALETAITTADHASDRST